MLVERDFLLYRSSREICFCLHILDRKKIFVDNDSKLQTHIIIIFTITVEVDSGMMKLTSSYSGNDICSLICSLGLYL